MTPEFCIQWRDEDLTEEGMEERAQWLGEQRQLASGCQDFFALAGMLVSYSRYEFRLISAAFIHATIGLERALRVHYKAPDEVFGSLCNGADQALSELLQRAVTEELVTDKLFEAPWPVPDKFLGATDGPSATHSEAITRLIPELRNRYAHGRYVLSPGLFHLTLEMRQIADALKTKPRRTLLD